MEYLRGAGCGERDRWLLAELILRLDADPIRHSERLVVDPPVPGLRWARCGELTVIVQVIPAEDLVRVVSVSR